MCMVYRCYYLIIILQGLLKATTPVKNLNDCFCFVFPSFYIQYCPQLASIMVRSLYLYISSVLLIPLVSIPSLSTFLMRSVVACPALLSTFLVSSVTSSLNFCTVYYSILPPLPLTFFALPAFCVSCSVMCLDTLSASLRLLIFLLAFLAFARFRILASLLPTSAVSY